MLLLELNNAEKLKKTEQLAYLSVRPHIPHTRYLYCRVLLSCTTHKCTTLSCITLHLQPTLLSSAKTICSLTLEAHQKDKSILNMKVKCILEESVLAIFCQALSGEPSSNRPAKCTTIFPVCSVSPMLLPGNSPVGGG